MGELLNHLEGGRRSDGTLSDQLEKFRTRLLQRVICPNRVHKNCRVQQDHEARRALIASRSRRNSSGAGTSIKGARSTAFSAARFSAVLPG
jgi:hypothetical protein